ncbi:hypothetical protein [Pacificimonas flava]|uniref:Uncharacterized protein n=1 Tax=Pacificimonas flava TaxID=1234595 RepID=M2S961_9SPHN|nr:hypothetical protein [Pacificimonas flava]EMD81905.1 hypothetical protein C725_2694 [Pacificimonas flava]MBB5281564.1 hypothetical protein [Pacificimonas flava]
MTIILLDRPETGEPFLPRMRRAVTARVHACAAEVDDLVDLDVSRDHAILGGCAVMQYAGLIVTGTACRRPLLFAEGEALGRRTGLDLLLMRFDVQPCGTTFDIRLDANGAWLTNFALWRGRGEMWLVPEAGEEACIKVTQFGLETCLPAPFASSDEREKGMVRAATFPTFKEGF